MTNRNVPHGAAEGLPSRELFRSMRARGASAWKRGVAIFGLVGAPVSGALGACALLIGYLFDTASLAPYFTTAGNALLFAVIPLLLLGAAVLDMLEADLSTHEEPGRAPGAAAASAAAPATAHVVPARKFRPLAAVALLASLGAFDPAFAQEPSTEREQRLLERVERLEQRVAELEAAFEPKPAEPAELAPAAQAADALPGPFGLPEGTTVNVMVDGYYGYNFNTPIGGVNLLRAYDPTSNSFNLAQANVLLERAPDLEAGRRYGLRLDLQFGQATETVQGSAANELRPQAFRHVLQAYGTYVVPVGNGLTVDFGKWLSAHGTEGHYTKDQMNYTRSYLFTFLPFYHDGFRASYPVNEHVSVGYWLVNGVQQTEDFNGFKSQNFQAIIKPTPRLSWTLNYYTGIEGRSHVANLNPTFPAGTTQPGLPVAEVRPSPRGRLHIVDSYATWNATDRLTLAGEFDYVINRAEVTSPPVHVTAGAAYARYQLAPRHAIAARGEYLSDRGGLFSGTTQALKETTATYEYSFADGFLTRLEYRRDFSNQPFFLTQQPGVLEKEQDTVTLGLVWWMGIKQGGW